VPLVLLACLAYISMAVPDSMLGVAWPWMRLDLHEPVAAVGAVLPFGITASVVASLLAGRLLDRVGAGRLLVAGTALSTASIAVTGLARSLGMLVAAGILVGLGSGGLDAALNAHAARRFGARDITWMHASYGLGATVGPLVITSVLASGTSWRWSYAAIGLVQAALTIVFALTRHRWSAPPSPSPAAVEAPATNGTPVGAPDRPEGAVAVLAPPLRRVRAVLLGVLVFAANTGIESGLGLWGYVFLTSGRGVPPAVAGVTVSGYWATMCVGRLVLGPVAQRVGTARVLAGAVTGVALGTVVLALPVPATAAGGAPGIGLPGFVAIGGMTLIGLATAPVFPLLTLTTADRVGTAGTGTAVGAQVAASSVGGAGLPILMGLLIGRYGGNVLGLCLLGLAVLLVPLFLALRRRH
jgi:fucose permease